MIFIWITLVVTTLIGSIIAINRGMDAYGGFVGRGIGLPLDDYGIETEPTPAGQPFWPVAFYCLISAALLVTCVISATRLATVLGWM